MKEWQGQIKWKFSGKSRRINVRESNPFELPGIYIQMLKDF
jgi:hypothetical protein